MEDLAERTDNDKAIVVAEALDRANAKYLDSNKSPSRKVGELDNRGSHFYLAMYWAEALAMQSADEELRDTFAIVAKKLSASESKITAELLSAQGRPVDIGGYFRPDPDLARQSMRPSKTLNAIIDSIT